MTIKETVTPQQTPGGDFERLFETLFNRFHKRIYAYIYRSIGSEDDAQDILQEVFMVLHHKLPDLEFEEDKIVYWLYRVARNLILAHLKKARRTTGREIIVPEHWDAAGRDNVEQHLELSEMERRLSEFLATLSEKERTIFLLHRVEKLKYKEIKDIMHLSERTLKRVVRRILERIEQLGLFDS